MKKMSILALMLATIMVCLTACGKNKDTAVIVNIQDNGNDSSKNEVLNNTDGKAEVKQDVDNTLEQETSDEIVEEEPDITVSIIGKWVGSDDNTYVFKAGNEFYGYNSETETNLEGTYETDESTYLKILIGYENGVETNKNLEYTINPITETIDDNEKEVSFSLTSGETVINLKKASELKQSDYEENEEDGVVEKELTGQELEDVRQELTNMGINPDTGLTFEEEAAMLALTPAVEQPQTEQVEQP